MLIRERSWKLFFLFLFLFNSFILIILYETKPQIFQYFKNQFTYASYVSLYSIYIRFTIWVIWSWFWYYHSWKKNIFFNFFCKWDREKREQGEEREREESTTVPLLYNYWFPLSCEFIHILILYHQTNFNNKILIFIFILKSSQSTLPPPHTHTDYTPKLLLLVTNAVNATKTTTPLSYALRVLTIKRTLPSTSEKELPLFTVPNARLTTLTSVLSGVALLVLTETLEEFVLNSAQTSPLKLTEPLSEL